MYCGATADARYIRIARTPIEYQRTIQLGALSNVVAQSSGSTCRHDWRSSAYSRRTLFGRVRRRKDDAFHHYLRTLNALPAARIEQLVAAQRSADPRFVAQLQQDLQHSDSYSARTALHELWCSAVGWPPATASSPAG